MSSIKMPSLRPPSPSRNPPIRTTSLPRPEDDHNWTESRSRKSSTTGTPSSPIWALNSPSDSSTPRLPYRSSPPSTLTPTSGFPRSPLHATRSQVSLNSSSSTRRPSNPTRSSSAIASPVLTSPSDHSHFSYSHSQKYDVKRMLSKPAPPSSSLGSTSTFLSAQSADVDDYIDDFLREGVGSGSPGNSAGGGNGGRLAKSPWSSAMTTASDQSQHPFPSSRSHPSSSYSTGADYDLHAGDVSSRRPSKASTINSNSQQPTISTQPTLMSSLDNYSLSNNPTPLQQKSSQATLSPFSGEFLDSSNTITVSSPYPESPVPRVMTPASAFIFAYQQSQLRSSNGRPATSPDPTSMNELGIGGPPGSSGAQYLTAPTSKSSSHHSRSVSPAGTYMSQSGNSSGQASPSPFSSLGSKSGTGKLVAVGSVEDSSKRAHKLTKPPPDPSAASSSSSSGIKGLKRKVSGKFGGRKGSAGKTSDDGHVPPPHMPVEVSVQVSVSSSSSSWNRLQDDTEEMRFGMDEDDESGGETRRGRSRRPDDLNLDYRYAPRIGVALSTSPLPPPSSQTPSMDSHGYHSGTGSGPSIDKPKMTRTKSRTTLFGISLGGGDEASSSSQPSTPATPNSAGAKDGGGMSLWKLVKKFSSSTLKEKHRTDRDENVPPVPTIPASLVGAGGYGSNDALARRRSSESIDYGEGAGSRFGYLESEYSSGGDYRAGSVDIREGGTPVKGGWRSSSHTGGARSRSGTISSSQYYSHGGQIAPTPPIPFSTKAKSSKSSNKSASITTTSKRSASQSRGAASSMMSSSPSDIASSRFFPPYQSPRTSTSSYGMESMSAYQMDGSTAGSVEGGGVPPIPKGVGQYIMPPDEIYAQMTLSGYAEDPSSYLTSSGASIKSGRSGPRPRPPAPPLPSNSYPQPRKSIGGMSYSGRSSLHRERSLSRPTTPPVPGYPQHPASSGSSLPHPASSTSSLASTNLANKNIRSKQKSATSAATESRNVVAVQGSIEDGGSYGATTSHVRSPSKASIGAISATSKKGGLLRRLGRSKSEVKLSAGIADDSLMGPTPAVPVLVSREERNPAGESNRFSTEKRDSVGSGSNTSAKRYSATRSTSLDSSGLRTKDGSGDQENGEARIAFRELKDGINVKKTEDEKLAMWDMLMEKSEKAGGTLRAKIDDSVY
ncbi:hypothetical protein FRC03_009495 [Tulasnella sp. 419]|nr:hypothetical protein FRC03_009495 [Tulasnella sp. 419]